MNFEIPKVFRGITDYYKGPSLYLMIIFIIISFIGATFLIVRVIRTEIIAQKQIYFCLSLFFLLYAVTRILFIFAIYIPDQYNQLTSFGYLSAITGVFFIIYIWEKYFLHTRRFFTIFNLILMIVVVISIILNLSRYFSLNILYLCFPFVLISIVLILFNLIYKTAGKMRIKTIENFSGISIMFFGHLLDSEFIYSFILIPLILPPILLIIGILIWFHSLIVIAILPDFYLSKKICIVHRGEIKKKIIFCKYCKIIYCERCFNYVKEKENRCWFCKKSFTSEADIITEEIEEKIIFEDEKNKIKKKSK